MIPDPANPKGIDAHNSRYTSSVVVPEDVGGGEYKITSGLKNNGLRVRFKPADSLERTNAIGKVVTLSWKYKVDDTAAGGTHLGWRGRAK